MKRFFLLGMTIIILSFMFVGCDTDGDDGELNGTVWKASWTWCSEECGEAGCEHSKVTDTLTLSFTSSSAITYTETRDNPSKTTTYTGTYTVKGNTVTIKIDGDTMVGIISGNKMNLDGEVDLIKQ